LKRVYLDILLLISLFLVPKLSFVNSIFNMYDEMVFVYMIFSILYRVFGSKKDILFPFLLTTYLLYSIFLIFYNNIPISHIMQVFITSKFLIIFLYFYTYSDTYKLVLFKKLMKLILFIFVVSLVISILQFVLPSYFYGYSPDGRGLLGINASGVFLSRISYSSFLVLFIVLIMSLTMNKEKIFKKIIRYRYWFLFISLILLVLTFARKEMIIGFMLLIYLFKDKVKKNSKIIFYLLLFGVLIAFIILFSILFADLNNSTFSEKQVRLLILLHSLDIFNFYFPFGSGPGTYGTVMSIDYTTVYEQFNVPRHIYLGYGDAVRGPIFDLYLFGLLAEYGMGIFFFLLFLKKMVFSNSIQNIDNLINSRKAKIALGIHLLIVSMFVPIFGNWIGFLIFSILGVLSSQRRSAHVLTK